MVCGLNVTHSFISVAILHGFFQAFEDAIELFVVALGWTDSQDEIPSVFTN